MRVDPEVLSAIIPAGAALLGVVIGAVSTYLIARSQHKMELERLYAEWWLEKEAGAYDRILGSLGALKHSLARWTTYEVSSQIEIPLEYQDDCKTLRDEYLEARTRIERAVMEGDYVVTERAAAAQGRRRCRLQRVLVRQLTP